MHKPSSALKIRGYNFMQSTNIEYVQIPRVGVVVVVSGGHEMHGQPNDSVSGWCRVGTDRQLCIKNPPSTGSA